MSRKHQAQATPPPSEPQPSGREELVKGLLLAWALLVTIVFFLQPSTTDVLVSFIFSLLGGGR